MKTSSFIFTSKSELANMIKSSETISITFFDGPNYFIQWEGDVPFEEARMERIFETDKGTDKSYSGPAALSQIITEIWARVKKYQSITDLSIDGVLMNLNEVARAAEIKASKKILNKTQISDRTIGLVSVMDPLKAKINIGSDQNAAEMADAFQDMICDLRASKSYGVSKYTKDNFKANMAKMTKAMREMQKDLNSCESSKSLACPWQ